MIDYASPFATPQSERYRLDKDLVIARYTEDDPVTGAKAGDAITANYATAFEVPPDVAASYWLQLRLPTSRADNVLIETAGDGVAGSPEWKRAVFLQLCESWSIAPTVTGEDYDRLQSWVFRWIDACVLDAISRGIAGRAEKKPGTRGPQGRSRARSTAPAASPSTD